uniref:UEV domain-containing protein n=1 Tax=Clastoptera arizonana TaxID=38151 RepID=A0A1B6CLS7_9HEMI
MLPTEDNKLRSYLSKYQNQDVTKRDIKNTLLQYKGLNFGREPFAFQNGISKELVFVRGVIPVTYEGNIYNIPVCIYLMDTHPSNAPMCYVKPTADMQIKVSQYVDHIGRIYLPYLHDWSWKSDLLGLIQVMICTFGEKPPVYAKVKKDKEPPYPTQSYIPMPGQASASFVPYPINSPYQPPNHGYPTQFAGYPSQNMYPTATPSYPPMPQTNTAVGGTGTITEEHIRASLLSAVEDKLRRRLDEQFAQSRAELDILQQSASELAQGKNKLEKILERLEKECNEMERNVTTLKEKEIELEKAINQLGEEESIDVDEAVTTTAPLYKQILNAFAEEAALEDAIYYMGEALRRGVIDLDVFLKQVRTLSRKQFMLRALMHKCRQKAGLAG